ncbi:MAG TPA: hypothetical protein DCS93_21860 [Microscillaceae bacterium]|nr:hypothetical protein [Microscillaceae bacterium]
MDSLGIDNNTREIVWKITPKPKKVTKKATAPKTKAVSTQSSTNKEPELKEMVSSQIQQLSSVLFEKLQGLEQEVKKLRATNVALENRVVAQNNIDTYTNDMVFQPWYL